SMLLLYRFYSERNMNTVNKYQRVTMTQSCVDLEFICSHNHALKSWDNSKFHKINDLKVGTLDAL
ncbi:hypothetical protein, partial [Vibrio sp. 10N.222.46.A1]